MKSSHPLTQSRGFTLLELVVVVAIIGLLASVALIPNLVRFQKRGAASAAKSDMTSLASAIALAGAEGCTKVKVKSDEELQCIQGNTTTYLGKIPRPRGGMSYFCSKNVTDTNQWNNMESQGCLNGSALDPTSSVWGVKATGFSGNAEFVCVAGACSCSVANGCTTR